MIDHYPILSNLSKLLRDRIFLSFQKNPQNEDEVINFPTFRKFYQIIIN
jgi:hypothetical protein